MTIRTAPAGKKPTALVKAAWIIPALLTLAAAIVWVTGGGRFTVGPFTISASSASRLVFDAVVVAAAIHAFARTGSRALGPVLCTALALSAAADSPTRRVGDGLEYLAMSTRIAALDSPTVVAEDLRAIAAEASAFDDDSWHGARIPTLRGRDGRHDFPHFWLFPAAAAPFVAAARAMGAHPAAGFTVFHVACLGLLALALARHDGDAAAVMMVCALLWWVDKTHAEIFIVTTIALGMLWLERRPHAATIAFAMATAQMPVFAPITAGSLALLLARDRTARALAAGVGCVAIAALHPLYYLWRLGRWSPLQDVATVHVPGLRALLTPFVDPNLGIAWYASALCLLAAIGAVAGASKVRRATVIALIGTAAIMVAAASTANVNHGGTPGPSRYGVWCLALAAPFAAEGARRLAATRPLVLAVATMLTLAFSAVVLHPRHQDSGAGPHPSGLARLLWTRAPALDNPLPEVFAERLAHVDGDAELPIATDGCEKVLLVGDGEYVWWPRRCVPIPAPRACVAPGAYCYANGSSIVIAPPQAGFAARLSAERTTGR